MSKPKPEKPDSSHNKSITQQNELYKQFCKDTDVLPYLLALLDDAADLLPDDIYSNKARLRDKATLTRRLSHEGLSFATVTLPLLSQGLFNYLETGHGRYPSFKLVKDAGHPEFLQGLFCLAYDEQSAHRDMAIELIYQISVSFKKLKGPYPASVLSKQLREFVLVNEQNADLDLFNDATFVILERARSYVKSLFEGFNENQVIPRPGPGATNEPVAKHLRYRPHVLYTKLDDSFPYVDFFNVHPYDCVHQTKFYMDLEKTRTYEPRARFEFVFKQFLKARGICIEENESQYLQQAYKNAMYQWIENHPLTRGFINFQRQDINALLALESSATLEFATLDESDASNRVAKVLVSWMFQDTDLHDPLMALSTSWIDLPFEVDGKRSIRTHMYAPMGSGLCFPVMSVVHWALCKSILSCSLLGDAAAKKVYVYGDDILVPTGGAQAIFDWLPRFGMKINENKSFFRSHFRESCGVHAWKGKNITPVYVKHIPSTSIDSAMSVIAVERQFHNKGYRHVTRILRSALESFHGKLPTTNVNSPIFGFKRDDCGLPSHHTMLRTRSDLYGNVQYRVRVVKSQQDRDKPPSEIECYLRSVLTKAHSRFIGGEPYNQKVVWQYVDYPQLVGIQPPAWLSALFNFNEDQNETNPNQEEKSSFSHLHTDLCPKRIPIFKENTGSRSLKGTRASRVRHPYISGWRVIYFERDGVVGYGTERCENCQRFHNRKCTGSSYGPDLPAKSSLVSFSVPRRMRLGR